MNGIVPESRLIRSMGVVITMALSTISCHLGGLDSAKGVPHAMAVPSIMLTIIGALCTSWWLLGQGARLANRIPSGALSVPSRLYVALTVALAGVAMYAMFAVFHASDR